tara:strand:- start:511 stop:1539 length:1029 start_codon:yes stop_codon:yes gene_type:complete
MSEIKWGIIGLGNIAFEFASAFTEIKNSKLLGIASNDSRRLNKFREHFELDKNYCFSNYEDLIKNKEIDIVYIALPHNFHFDWINQCIDLKKNILSEKPATINLSQIKIINQKLNKNNIFFAEGFMYSYHPQLFKLFEILNEKIIGEILKMESSFGVNIVEKKNFLGFKRIKINEKSRLFKKELAGGCILDLGCYPTSLSVLISKFKSNKLNDKFKINKSKILMGPTNVEIEASAQIEFQNEFKSDVKCSFRENLGEVTKIIGSKGEIIIPHSWKCRPSKIIVNSKEYNVDNLYKNIFSYEIETISNFIINKKKDPEFPAINRFETEVNMGILEKWISTNEK